MYFKTHLAFTVRILSSSETTGRAGLWFVLLTLSPQRPAACHKYTKRNVSVSEQTVFHARSRAWDFAHLLTLLGSTAPLYLPALMFSCFFLRLGCPIPSPSHRVEGVPFFQDRLLRETFPGLSSQRSVRTTRLHGLGAVQNGPCPL